MERWDIYDVKRAVKLYLNSEEKINWETDCIIVDGIIVEWNIASKDKPTIIDLDDYWYAGKLEHYKSLQKKALSEEFNHLLRNGYGGCTTTVKGNNDEFIVVDARRGGDYDDYANFRMSIDLIKYTGIPTIEVKDYYNNQHEIASEHMETLYKDLILYGMVFLQKKWGKIKEIENSTSIEDIVKITML